MLAADAQRDAGTDTESDKSILLHEQEPYQAKGPEIWCA